MATIDQPLPLPLGEGRGEGSVAQADRWLAWATTVDHKRIGALYLLTALGFFAMGGVEALLIRAQLALPGLQVLPPWLYNQIFTMHGVTMIFLVAIPALLGMTNYVVPLMIGARDMAYPRLNALSYWITLFGGLLLVLSFLTGGAPDAGWFNYVPLSARAYAINPNIDYWIVGLLVLTVGTVATAINLCATVILLRAPGMTLLRLPLFAWMMLVTGFLILFAMPPLTAASAMLLVDRHLGGHFFNAASGGDPLLWQHYFWAFGHPEVYIVILPAMGMVSEVIPVFARQPLFRVHFFILATLGIAFLSYLVWAHHMFAVGMGTWANAYFSFASMLIAIPTGIKVFHWLATMWRGKLHFTTAMLFAMGFVGTFTVGGLSGVTLAAAPVDWQVTDTYYVVAHFHYVLFGGVVFGLFAGSYYWFPKLTGRLLNERLGKLHFWLTLIGFNVTFFPQHILGLIGMPRRIYTYAANPGWTELNLLSSLGAATLGLASAIFAWNVLRSMRAGRAAGADPWDGWTLEWATSSPPPPTNFSGPLPPVRSRRPLWDLKQAAGTGKALAARAGDTLAATLPERNQLGVLLLCSSEAVFFVALILAYVLLHGRGSGPDARAALDVGSTLMFSLCLFASSATVWLAGRLLARDRRGASLLALLATVALGAVFIYGQWREWSRLLGQGISPERNLFGSTFFTLTGFHGLHVLVGMTMLLLLALFVVTGDLTARRRAGLEAVSVYWHFVDAVWVAVFSVVYLATLA